MKNIFVVGVMILSVLAVPFADARAAVTTSNVVIVDPSFKINVTDIFKATSTGITRFGFEPTAIQNNAAIAYWKIRVYCEDEVKIGINELLNANFCGKAADIANGASNSFSITLLENKSDTPANFSFKLKAYDRNGKWLHTEKEAFRWK